MATVYTRERVDTLLEGKSNDDHVHSGAEITTGTVNKARIGTGTPAAGQYVDGGTGAWTNLPASTQINDTTPGTTTTFSSSRINTLVNGKADTSHTHSASEIASGTFATARIGSGTAGAGKYVDGATGAWTPLPAGSAGVTMVDNGDGTITLT